MPPAAKGQDQVTLGSNSIFINWMKRIRSEIEWLWAAVPAAHNHSISEVNTVFWDELSIDQVILPMQE
jgi:hypothetical protein